MAGSELPAGRSGVGPLLLFSAVAIALLYTGSLPIHTNDLHVYLIQGRWMMEHGQLLETELYTWVAQGDAYMNANWGFTLAAYWIYELGGYPGIRIFNGLMVAAAVLGVCRAAMIRGAGYRAASAAAVYVWFMMLQNTVIRGQTWCFPLFAGLVWLAAAPRSHWKHLVGGVVGGALWASLHGSFGAGICWMGAWAVGDAWDERDWRAGVPAALTAAGMAAGTLIGPYGPAIWDYVYWNALLSVDRGFGEWQTTSPSTFEGAKFFAALGMWMAMFARSERRAATASVLQLLGFAFLAINGVRFVAWFGMATAIPFALYLHRRLAPEEGLPTRLVRICGGVLAALWLLFLVRGLAPKDQPLHRDTPIAHVDAIEADAQSRSLEGGRIFAPPEYGGYVSWRLWPGFLHCGDIRTWVFDDEAWNHYLLVSWHDDDWQATLDADGVTHLMLWRAFHGDRLLPAVEGSAAWEKIHDDDWGATFRRR